MPTIHEQVSEQFFDFVRKGQGWTLYPFPVSPEPGFDPFYGYSLFPVLDDGKKPTWLSLLTRRVGRLIDGFETEHIDLPEVPKHSLPRSLKRHKELVALRCTLPCDVRTSRSAFEALLSISDACEEPLAFEYLGNSREVSAQVVMHPSDFAIVEAQVGSYFPESAFIQASESLDDFKDSEQNVAILEFGLSREFFYALASPKADPLIGILGALSHLSEHEAAVIQIIFEPCNAPWGETLVRYVSDQSGKSLFVNRPELSGIVQEKLQSRLNAVVLRMAAKGETIQHAWEVLRRLAVPFRVFADPSRNELLPLTNDGYPFEDHLEDLLRRQTRRCGMLLSANELYGLVHFPSSEVIGHKFLRNVRKSRCAPPIVQTDEGLLLGGNLHAGVSKEVRLSSEKRTRHIHIIGASGSGKSTLLFNSIQQDLMAGEGIAVLDPHGDLIDSLLGIIPEHRINDVILLDPSDETASIAFNVLSAHNDLEKGLLSSDLISVFRRLSQAWGDQMESVLRNAIVAFLESRRGGNLADLRRFLIDNKFRQEFVTTVTDPDIRFYWEKAFSQLHGNKSIGPVLTRLDTFLSPKPLRYLVAQKKNSLNFAQILDSGKIFLAKLSQGELGKENSFLLGSLLMAKLQQAAMSRQRQSASNRRNFWIYIDEFHNFITPTLAEILSGARKYRVGMMLAHQELRQLERDREVASAVLSNCGTRIVFRVGDSDAKTLESGFASFKANDLQSLRPGEAIARIERSSDDFNLDVPFPATSDEAECNQRRLNVISTSRARYATPREVIEADFAKAHRSAEPGKDEFITSQESFSPPSFDSILVAEPAAPSSSLPSSPEDITNKEPALLLSKSLGRGGEQHRAIQYRIKAAGESLGFKALVEHDLGSNAGSVDLALFLNGEKKIAVEIGITTTIDHEVGNVLKCLRANFPLIVMLATSDSKLEQIKHGVHAAINSELSARVRFFQTDEFLSFLPGYCKEISNARIAGTKTAKRRGYKVTRSVPQLSQTELAQKEAEAIKEIAKVLKGKSI